MKKNIYKYLIDRSVINIKGDGLKVIEILVKSIKLLIYMYVEVWQTCINMFKSFLQEEESSTRLNIMIKKFQKDIKSLSTNRIFKRNIYTHWNKYPKQTEKALVKLGVNKDNAKQISVHPTILAETEEGHLIVGNHTSSPIVDNQLTIKVGIQENGKSSYLPVNKSEIIKKMTAGKFIESIVSEKVDKTGSYKDVYPLNGKEGNKIANNTSDELENKHGVKIKNKNLESIESVCKEPVDKL